MPADLEQRGLAFLQALAASQGIPAEDLANSFRKYNASVLQWYVTVWETEGLDAFQEAFRLVDVLEGLGCKDLDFQDPDRLDPVNLGGTGPTGGPFQLTIRRAALGLDRGGLTSLVRTNLGLPDEAPMPAPPPRPPSTPTAKVEAPSPADAPPPTDPGPPTAATTTSVTKGGTKKQTRKQTRARPKVPPLKPAKSLSGSFPPKPAEPTPATTAEAAPATAAAPAPVPAPAGSAAQATTSATKRPDPYAAALKGWAAKLAGGPTPPARPPPAPPPPPAPAAAAEPPEDDLAPIVMPVAATLPAPPEALDSPAQTPAAPEPEPAPAADPPPAEPSTAEPAAAEAPPTTPEPAPAPAAEPELAPPSAAPLPSWMDRDSAKNRTGGIPRGADTTNVLLSGKLREMSLPDLVQILQFQRKTGVLKILASGAKKVQLGAVWFQRGDVWDAQAGDLMGEEAFYRLALMDDGSFRFGAGAAAKRNITRPTTTLLMESMRRRDEAGRPPDGEAPSGG